MVRSPDEVQILLVKEDRGLRSSWLKCWTAYCRRESTYNEIVEFKTLSVTNNPELGHIAAPEVGGERIYEESRRIEMRF